MKIPFAMEKVIHNSCDKCIRDLPDMHCSHSSDLWPSGFCACISGKPLMHMLNYYMYYAHYLFYNY